ncbi:hypothetical protein [Thiothrix nivea]|uniref:DUF4332 domain-containing protein n=1 Tax=Thiothrix nivea (strain ATCC 35100 / DSM 5205 / JP2) TaxID=870187 RepID=A0A656HH62_THINJ|nr:hypothetical protein [Thiothrix nivea]EIJ34539.1 hypothetical protein Thini_1965 [Thiothrix nivea DSM 5205]
MSDANHADDLTLIKGIGPVRQQWLLEHFNADSFQALAALNPLEVERLLSLEKAAPSLKEITRWIQEAGELASQVAGNGNGNCHECRSLATFIVDYLTYLDDGGERQFKTLVTQMDVETDSAVSEEWPSLKQHQPCEWMKQRLDAALLSQQIAPHDESPTATDHVQPEPGKLPANLRARILAYEMHWPTGSFQVQSPFSAEKQVTLEAGSHFGLDIRFSLQGLPEGLGQAVGYHAACHVIPVGKHSESACLQGNVLRQLEPGETAGVARMQALSLPAGHYEAWLSVTPDTAGSRPDLAQGPRLMVI